MGGRVNEGSSVRGDRRYRAVAGQGAIRIMDTNELGVVVIGRNEGERLERCLRSVMGEGAPVVYVDSGSTDGSAKAASALGVRVVELDESMPFTAARSRNAGAECLMASNPGLGRLQFVDGDVELAEGWLRRAELLLRQRSDVAIAVGRLRERYPQASVYNQLCDMEWDTPLGELQACGGIFMIRVKAFEEVGGFDQTMIAGEEPHLCARLRDRGWKVWRVDAEMGWHDAAISRFRQWWKRMVRSGHAYLQGACRRDVGRRGDARRVAGILFWAIVLPVAVVATVGPSGGLALVLFLAYPMQCCRIAHRRHAGGDAWGPAWSYGLFITIAKFAEAQGCLLFIVARLSGRPSRGIEYKRRGIRADGQTAKRGCTA